MTPPLDEGALERRRQLAAEVLELGEALFDATIEAAVSRLPADEAEPFPEDELRTSADEFFRAMRALLGLPQDGTTMP